MKEFCEQLENPTWAEQLGCWIGGGGTLMVVVGFLVGFVVIFCAADAWRELHTRILRWEVEEVKHDLEMKEQLIASRDDLLKKMTAGERGLVNQVAGLARSVGLKIVQEEN